MSTGVVSARPTTTGKDIRLARLFRRDSGRVFVLPLDHSVTDGPITTARGLDHLVGTAAEAGVNAVVVHKGRVGSIAPERWRELALVVHLSASTRHAADPDAKVLVGSVEDALLLGADAVGVHINMGSATERKQLADLGRIARDCAHWQIPLLAMMYARGPNIENALDPQLLSHAASLAADLGADLVKLPYTGSVTSMRPVVESCPIPLLVAGGPQLGSSEALDRFVRDAILAGAAGVAVGRNVFTATDPAATARRVAAIVHGERRAPAPGVGNPIR